MYIKGYWKASQEAYKKLEELGYNDIFKKEGNAGTRFLGYDRFHLDDDHVKFFSIRWGGISTPTYIRLKDE